MKNDGILSILNILYLTGLTGWTGYKLTSEICDAKDIQVIL
jgi:hypothetical protein